MYRKGILWPPRVLGLLVELGRPVPRTEIYDILNARHPNPTSKDPLSILRAAVSNLECRGLIEADDMRLTAQKRTYTITEDGLKALKAYENVECEFQSSP